jgi:DNA polymerase (family X)
MGPGAGSESFKPHCAIPFAFRIARYARRSASPNSHDRCLQNGPSLCIQTRVVHSPEAGVPAKSGILSNAEIADRLSALAQLLTIEKANPFKVRAYQRAAATIRGLGESVDELVRGNADLRVYPGIGEALNGALREIVLTGTLASLEKLHSKSSPELVAISTHPRLDPKRVLRIYKKLGISTMDALRSSLESGEIERIFGGRMAQHVKQGLIESKTILLHHAHQLRATIEEFLINRCNGTRAEAVGDYRRSVEVISELSFVVETADFFQMAERMQRFGGHLPMLQSRMDSATYSLPSGPRLRLEPSDAKNWGLSLVRHTGSQTHLRKLTRITGSLVALQETKSFSTEEAFYQNFGMSFIPPELREGLDEVQKARGKTLPNLVTEKDVRGDLHAHTFASDGVDSIEDMAQAAREMGYEYVGITDHSRSLKIAHGLSIEGLWKQIQAIDRLNARLKGIRVLKSAEVDILVDGSLDYPDELLRELDYTVCSIHSRFGLSKQQQTERILRAMDNRYFTLLGHATGRLLLKRPGYELDFERIIDHARQNGCFFELNCSPDRLDVSAEKARLVRAAGIRIAISTDSHSVGEYRTVRYGIEQARRAGLERADVLNCHPLNELMNLLDR